MSVLIQGDQLRALSLGGKVERSPAVLPATTQSAIFTVSGGRVVVTALIGEVTTVCSATATTLKVTANPTTGSDVDIATATAETSQEVGSLVSLPLTLAGALNVQNAGAGQVPASVGFVIPIGTIDLVTSATNTGALKWTLFYYPLDNGASVTAA